jgi:predicted MFS family arabinose efflux permease
MLPLELFRNRTYTGANTVILLVALAMFGVFFFVSLYMQNILGYSAVQAGAAFLPMTLLIVVIAPLAGRMTDRIGSRAFMTIGMTLLAIQLLYFSRLGSHATYWELLPAMIIGGIGMASTMTPSAAAATRSVPVDKAGVGSAVLNAFRQVGGSVGIALMGAIMASKTGGARPEPGAVLSPAQQDAFKSAFMDGFHSALMVAALIAFAGAIVAFVLVRPHEQEQAQHDELGAPELAA